jgi:hypothetical protein
MGKVPLRGTLPLEFQRQAHIVKPAAQQFFFWLLGPLIAVGFVAFAVGFNVLVGLWFLCILGAAAFLFVMPLIQLLLLNTQHFRGRYGATCGIALGLTTASLLALMFAGIFNICQAARPR